MPTTLASGASSLSLPDIGSLIWADERGWQDVVQTVTRCFGGAAVIQESAPMTGGRPMTLTGDLPWATINQANLDALTALLAPAGSTHTCTLEDGRAYTVTARRDAGPAVQSRQLPAVGDSPLAVSDDDTLHALVAVRLLILDGPL